MSRITVFFLNFLTVLAAWMYWTAGNMGDSHVFIAWAGKNPGLHRVAIAAVLAIFFFLLYFAHKRLAQEFFSGLWMARLWTMLNRWNNAWVVLGLSVFTVWSIGRVNVARHEVFCSGFDLAIFDQAIWNTLQGRFLWSSIKGHICLLGDHMSPVLLVYVPWMALWEDTRILLWAQAAVVGVNGFMIYLLCRQKWAQSPLNWVFSLTYFLYLPVRNVAHFDFHPEILADTFIFLAFFLWAKGQKAGFLLCLLGLVLCKETFWGLIFFLGLYLWLCEKRRWGLLLAVIAPAAFWWTTAYGIPALSGRPYPYVNNYTTAGLGQILKNALSVSSLGYLVKIFAPLGFLSLLSPGILFLACFGLLQNLCSINPATHSIFFQYTIGLTPFVFIAAIFAVDNLLSGKVTIPWFRSLAPSPNVLALWVLTWCVLFSGVSEHYRYLAYKSQKTPGLDKIATALREIPPGAIVKTNEFFAAHLAHRVYLYIPDDGGFWPFEKGATTREEKLAIGAKGFGSGASDDNFQFLKQHGYEMIKSEDGVYAMKEKVVS